MSRRLKSNSLSDKCYPQNELQKLCDNLKISDFSLVIRSDRLYYFIAGGQIWCEIISELNFGAELLSSFTIQEATKSVPCSPDSTGIKEKEEEDVDMDLKSEVKKSPSFSPTSPVTNGNIVNHGEF